MSFVTPPPNRPTGSPWPSLSQGPKADTGRALSTGTHMFVHAQAHGYSNCHTAI